MCLWFQEPSKVLGPYPHRYGRELGEPGSSVWMCSQLSVEVEFLDNVVT